MARRRVVGELLAAERLPGGLVLLLGGPGSVGPARLVVVDAGGGVRSVRRAAWLGGGLLAVWGHDDSEPVVRGSVVEQWPRPAGLRVVDTRTWTAVTVHADAGAVTVAGVGCWCRVGCWGRRQASTRGRRRCGRSG